MLFDPNLICLPELSIDFSKKLIFYYFEIKNFLHKILCNFCGNFDCIYKFIAAHCVNTFDTNDECLTFKIKNYF